MSTNAFSYEIVQVAPPGSPDRKALYDQCLQVRIEVFVNEQKFSIDDEIDAYDKDATHFLLRLLPSATPIGTIRMYRPAGLSYYKLARLAVLKDYRKYRLGAALVAKGHQWVIDEYNRLGLDRGSLEVVVHSQIPVKTFYARFGYLPEGDEFDEDGAPHQKMILRLDPNPS